jgi:xanthine/CO dehydrogenase XdhC/CoxF family maturation factor
MKSLTQILRRACTERTRIWALATLVRTHGSTYRKAGARLLVDASGETTGVLSGGCLEEEIAKYGQDVIETFIHTIPPPIRLLLFGAGPEIAPLQALAVPLGWLVQRFAHSSDLSYDFRADDQTVGIIMTHNFGRDLAALDRLLPLRLPYLGLLGPRKRHAELVAHYAGLRDLDPAWLSPLHAPAGLDIGSEAPEEIALSILSEISAVLAGRTAGFLRDRATAIHALAPSVIPERAETAA